MCIIICFLLLCTFAVITYFFWPELEWLKDAWQNGFQDSHSILHLIALSVLLILLLISVILFCYIWSQYHSIRKLEQQIKDLERQPLIQPVNV